MNRISNREFYLAAGEMTLSAFCVALVSLFGKELTGQASLTVLIALRFILPLIVLGWIALVSTARDYSLKEWRVHLLRAVFTVASQYCFFAYLQHGNVLIGTLLFGTSTLFSPLIGRMILKHPTPMKTWVSIAISFLGVILILDPNPKLFNSFALLGLLAGFLNACSQLTLHHTSKKESSATVTINMYLFSSALSLIPLVLFSHTGDFNFLFSSSSASVTWLLLIGFVVASITNQSVRALAYRHVNKAASLGPFLYTSIIFAGLFDWLVYHQIPTHLTIAGTILIIIGGIMMSLRRLKSTKT